mgnify:CR=1 FL=1
MQTTINRDELLDAYAQHQLNSMSGRDLERFFLDVFVERLEDLSIEELIIEIKTYSPELLVNS